MNDIKVAIHIPAKNRQKDSSQKLDGIFEVYPLMPDEYEKEKERRKPVYRFKIENEDKQ